MSLQEYREKWVDVDRIRTPISWLGRGAQSCSFTVERKATHLAAPTKRISTATFVDPARKFRLTSVDRLTFGQQIARLYGRSRRLRAVDK